MVASLRGNDSEAMARTDPISEIGRDVSRPREQLLIICRHGQQAKAPPPDQQ